MKIQRVLAKKNSDFPRKTVRLIGIIAGLAVLAIAPVLSEGGQQPIPPPNPPGMTPHQIYPTPDAKGITDGDEGQTPQQNKEAIAAEQKRELVADTNKLLALVTDLKAAVDGSNKDILSADVVRKAEAIEKLAHHVKGELKITVEPH
jgi:hypothetical protein